MRDMGAPPVHYSRGQLPGKRSAPPKTNPRPQLALRRPAHIGTRLPQQCLIGAMPRYFFHVTNGDSITDEEGEEFELFEAAREHAIAVARELVREGLKWAGHSISVTDERGTIVFKVPL